MIDPKLIMWLADFLGKNSRDPYAFVIGAFPWGREGSELEDQTGPDDWQVEQLKAIRDGLKTAGEVIRCGTSSGHGVGKSALVAWLIIWALSTMEDTKGVVTANTENQLRTKTWAELAKWHRLFVGNHMFTYAATSLHSTVPAHEKTWRIDMIPWSENNTEAFAGLHNKGKRIIVVFDEASAIPDIIWETTEGALTDDNTQIIWAVYGNPTRNTGRFKECWGRFRHRWLTQKVDSRTAKMTNKAQIAQWVADYGEDSDFVRVRVRGEFPRSGSTQFISGEVVENCVMVEAISNMSDPLVIGVDVARFGDDQSVIYFRKGRDGRTIAPIKMRHDNDPMPTMTLAAKAYEQALFYHADAIFVDGGGVGGGVVDRLRQLGATVIEVQFGGKADRSAAAVEGKESASYANKRAEMWGNMRDWLNMGGAIPNDQELKTDLTGLEYAFNIRNEIQLERKEDMKKRGLASPDVADALALTFAYPVAPRQHAGMPGRVERVALESDYDPFADLGK